jgi:hypothetical protein
MDLNRQALLIMAITVLGPAVVWHGRHPFRLAGTIAGQAVLPGTGSPAAARAGADRRPAGAAVAWATAVVVLELGALVVCVASLFSSTGRPAGVLLAVSGVAFVAYVALLLRRGYRGDCGCAPVAASVTGISLVPGSVLLVAGLVLAADPSLDDVALAHGSGGLDTALALAAAGLLGALVSLLPASALIGDPRRLEPDAPAAQTTRPAAVGEA